MATITSTSSKQREQLRRSALAADQGPNDEQQANSYPRGTELDLLGDPQDPTNVTFPFLRRMRRDHMVAMGLHFIAMPIVRAPWYFEADDARVAAFADNIIRPIYGNLMLTLLRMLWAGYSPAVKNFQTVNPAWTYRPGMGEDPKRVWDQGGIDALVYKPVTPLRPENSLPTWDANGNFNGIKYDGRYGGIGYFMVGGERKPNVDLLHSVWAVHDSDTEDGSPFGFPRISHCAPIFHMYRFIWTMLGRAFENNADPGPVVRFPEDDVPRTDSNGKPIKNVDAALRIGRRRRSGSTVALPSTTYDDFQGKSTGVKKWDIEYVKNVTDFADLQNFIGFLESAKLRALWLQEQGIIEGSGGASNRNVAFEFGQQRDDSQIVLMGQIDDVIMESLVKPAVAMNMPWYEGNLTKKNVGFGSEEEVVVRQILQLAGQQDFRTFGVDVHRILDAQGVPMLSSADYAKVQKQIATEVDNAPAPAVTPTQGRRALVTQTGFDRQTRQPEMSYVQVEDPIHLAADGDFVSALPRTDVFADKQVVNATRAMRTASLGFLTWAYDDFARYLGKQKTMDLSELLEEIAVEHFAETSEELAVEDRVRKAVDRIVAGWRPRVDRVNDFAAKTRSALGRVYDRTTGIHLSRLSSKSRVSSTDKIAATWLDEQGAAMVTGILETTRQQLASVLADGVRDKKTPRQIAADIREHFDGFPEARAATIARTEVSQAYNFATVSAGMAAGISKGQLLDGNKDETCKARNGKIVSLAEALKEKLSHPNAIIAGTAVEAFGDVEVGLSAPWSGPVLELTSASGNRLTVTPNHPVLTHRGWVKAKDLREGDYVVRTPAVDRSSVDGMGSDLEHVPPLVEEVLDALRPTGSHSRVVASPDDLHGDGHLVDGEVDVVRANRLLLRDGETALLKHGRELLFGEADSELALLARDCTSGARLQTVALATAGGVGGSGMGGVIVPRSYLDSTLAEPLDDRVRVDAMGLRQLGRALARPVALDQIIKILRLPRWTGHVYDLQTSSSMYAAGGIVVHNCTFTVRLLPRASANLEVRYEALDGLYARFDEATETILFSPDITVADETTYLLALGDMLSATEGAA